MAVQFIGELWNAWGALMTGALVAALLYFASRVSAKYRGTPELPGKVYGWIAGITLIISFYQMWGDMKLKIDVLKSEKTEQQRKFDAEKNDLQEKLDSKKPNLLGGYYKAYCTGSGRFLVLVYIKNVGGMPSSAHNFTISSSGPEIGLILARKNVDVSQYLPEPFEDRKLVIKMNESIQQRSMLQPIPPGVEVRGWLLAFPLDDGVIGCVGLDDVSIAFTDVLGQKTSFKVQSTLPLPPLPPVADFVNFPSNVRLKRE